VTRGRALPLAMILISADRLDITDARLTPGFSLVENPH